MHTFDLFTHQTTDAYSIVHRFHASHGNVLTGKLAEVNLNGDLNGGTVTVEVHCRVFETWTSVAVLSAANPFARFSFMKTQEGIRARLKGTKGAADVSVAVVVKGADETPAESPAKHSAERKRPYSETAYENNTTITYH